MAGQDHVSQRQPNAADGLAGIEADAEEAHRSVGTRVRREDTERTPCQVEELHRRQIRDFDVKKDRAKGADRGTRAWRTRDVEGDIHLVAADRGKDPLCAERLQVHVVRLPATEAKQDIATTARCRATVLLAASADEETAVGRTQLRSARKTRRQPVELVIRHEVGIGNGIERRRLPVDLAPAGGNARCRSDTVIGSEIAAKPRQSITADRHNVNGPNDTATVVLTRVRRDDPGPLVRSAPGDDRREPAAGRRAKREAIDYAAPGITAGRRRASRA